MKYMLFGIGAGGNKAAINVLKKGYLNEKYVKILNTSTKDIPEEYKINSDLAVYFSSMFGGCGKEPLKGKKAIINAIKNGNIKFGEMIEPDTQAVIIVTTTEGGTGCGATPVIANYFVKLNLPVHVFALIGFQDEARGINNTLRFFRELDSNVILHTIKNEEFLDYSKNYAKAEALANDEFAEQVRILSGADMIPSHQNIDDTDMYKVATTSGYMNIQHVSLDKVKNVDLFNKAVQESFENIKCLDFDKSALRLAVIINAKPETQTHIDDKFEVIKRYIGEPYEKFRHIQYDETQPEYIDIISCGMNFPEQGIRDLNDKYMDIKEKLNSEHKSFDDIFADIDLDDEDDEFDVHIRKMKNPDDIDLLFSNMDEEKTTKHKVSKVTTSSDNEY